MDYRDLKVTECLLGNDGEMLCFALDRVRKEFAWKTGGLDVEQLRRRHPPSMMTLAGLIKHMASVEHGFTARALGLPDPSRNSVEDAGPDEWESALADEPEVLYSLWYHEVERSQAAWEEMIADGGLDVIVPDPDPAWNKNRRRILVDLLEENLIHLGHVDLLREWVDGRRGHGWPE